MTVHQWKLILLEVSSSCSVVGMRVGSLNDLIKVFGSPSLVETVGKKALAVYSPRCCIKLETVKSASVVRQFLV